MNEVDKLYSNAGIKSKAECTSKVCIVTNPHKDWCNKCESLKYEYPPFTAKKQIELIKWCLDNYRGYVFDSIETEWFEEQLCAFINNIWQDLTDAEKQQIKEILNE